MDLHPNMMSRLKANTYGLLAKSKALESVGCTKSGNPDDNHGGQKMLNNNSSNDLHSNYNYSPLVGHNAPACSSSSSPTNNRDTDYTPRCMRPKSQSFQEEIVDPSERRHQVSPPILTTSTNPFLPSGSTSRQFIYNDLQKGISMMGQPKSPNTEDGLYYELQDIKSNKQREYLETNFELNEDKLRYKHNLGVPMVGMVSNAELVKINTQSPISPMATTEPLYPVAAIHPSQAVPLSSIFGLSLPNITPETAQPPAVAPQAQPSLEVNPNSKSTDIF